MNKNLNNSNLEPFLVHVTEIYTRNVVVYAENPDMAKQLANELCEEGLLLIDFDNFADRNVETIRKAKEIELNIFQAFGPDTPPETLNISLKDKIQNAEENTISLPQKDISNNEPIL